MKIFSVSVTFIFFAMSSHLFACKTTPINGSQRFIKGVIQKIDTNKYRAYTIKNIEQNIQHIIIELSGSKNECIEQKYKVKGKPNCEVVATLISSTSCSN